MTEAIYQEVSVKAEKAKEQNRRISVCGMLKYLDVSRSGYHAWQHRKPSEYNGPMDLDQCLKF